MRIKKSFASVAAFLIAVAIFAGVYAVASGIGTSSDPLVSLSYINEKLTPELEQYVDETVEQKSNEITYRFEDKIAEFSLYAMAANNNMSAAPAAYTDIELAEGEYVVIEAGKSIIIRDGDAYAQFSVSDAASGETISAGTQLETNNIYLINEDTNIIASTDSSLLVLTD